MVVSNNDEQQEVEETLQEPAPQPSATFNYRYACPACTGIAFYANEVYDKPEEGTICKNCGVGFTGLSKDRYILLNEQEKQQLEALRH